MSAWWAFAGGLGGGLAASALVALWAWRRGWIRTDHVSVSSEQEDAVADEFRRHAEAVATQVSGFADHLADGDLVLRERLRRFERGGTS